MVRKPLRGQAREDLRLACQASKSACVQDAGGVARKRSAIGVWRLRMDSSQQRTVRTANYRDSRRQRRGRFGLEPNHRNQPSLRDYRNRCSGLVIPQKRGQGSVGRPFVLREMPWRGGHSTARSLRRRWLSAPLWRFRRRAARIYSGFAWPVELSSLASLTRAPSSFFCTFSTSPGSTSAADALANSSSDSCHCAAANRMRPVFS